MSPSDSPDHPGAIFIYSESSEVSYSTNKELVRTFCLRFLTANLLKYFYFCCSALLRELTLENTIELFESYLLFLTENRVQISQDCLLPLSQQQSAYQRDNSMEPCISLENNVIKSQSSSKSETAPYQQVSTYLNTTSDRFRLPHNNLPSCSSETQPPLSLLRSFLKRQWCFCCIVLLGVC